MTDCNQKTFEFQGLGKRKITADFRVDTLSRIVRNLISNICEQCGLAVMVVG